MAEALRPEVVRDVELLGAEAISILRKFLSQAEFTKLDLERARVAQSTFASWTRNRQTENARESNFLILARELAEDKNQFRRFVRLGMPNAPILKALPSADVPMPARKRRAS